MAINLCIIGLSVRQIKLTTPVSFHFRAELKIDNDKESARLRLDDIRTSDEGEYKCEITFLDITKDCPVVQLVKLTTLGKYPVIKKAICQIS